MREHVNARRAEVRGHPGEMRYAVVNEFHWAGRSEGVRLRADDIGWMERHISPNEVKYAILSGEVIEEYPKDKYGPSCLIYGVSEEGGILHVQCSMTLFGSLRHMTQL